MASPLALIGLMLIILWATPGDAFFSGQAIGVYWLFEHNLDLIHGFAQGIVFAAVCGVIVSLGRIPFRKPVRLADAALLAANLVVLAGYATLTLLPDLCCFQAAIPVDTQYADGQVYHLAARPCFYDSDCRHNPGDFLRSRYIVVDCGALDVVCRVVYITQPHGRGLADPPPLPSPSVPEFHRSPSNRLQLVDGSRILWQSP